MSTIRAIIFDLDDTLYPERDYAFSGFDAVARAVADRLHAPFDLAVRMGELFDTPDRGRVFNVILDELGVPNADSLVPEMIAAFREHAPNITLHPDAHAALARLVPEFKLGLITDGYSAVQHAKIDALGLAGRLGELVVTDDWGRRYWKPHPRAFQEMSRRLNVSPRACTYVADNLAKDFVTPRTLGWCTVCIKRPGSIYADNQAPVGGAPHKTITTLDML